MKFLYPLLVALTVAVSSQAQTETPAVKSNTLDAQFTDVIEKSNRYQDYKVVKIFKLNKLRKNVNDTIAAIEKNLTTAHITIDEQKGEIATLTSNLEKIQSDLLVSQQKENGIEMFGSITEKSTYKTIMWSIIGLLTIGLLFFVYKFKNSNSVTKEAQHKLAETEAEFDEHRQKTLEQHQILRRKLQDELNKSKKA